MGKLRSESLRPYPAPIVAAPRSRPSGWERGALRRSTVGGVTYYGINDRPTHCPFGHDLGPGKASLSWDMQIQHHWLLCGGCERRTGIILEQDDAEWQVHRDGRWVPYRQR